MVEIRNELTLKNYFKIIYYTFGFKNIVILMFSYLLFIPLIFAENEFFFLKFIPLIVFGIALTVIIKTILKFRKLNEKFITYKFNETELVIKHTEIGESSIFLSFMKKVYLKEKIVIIETKSGKQPILLTELDRENLESFFKTSKWNSLVVYK